MVDSSGNIVGDIADTLAEGSIYIGDATNTTSEVDASTDGQILVGNGTTVTSVAMSGQALIDNTGAVTIQDLDSSTFAHPKLVVYQETVTAAALTDGGAAVITSYSIHYTKLYEDCWDQERD